MYAICVYFIVPLFVALRNYARSILTENIKKHMFQLHEIRN